MDELTGLGGRTEFAASLIKRGAEGAPAIYLNIDGFNGVNYSFGHLEGDRILVELARWLAGKATALGVEVFRIGGNEFVLVGAALADARPRDVAAELVRESQALGFPYAHPLNDRTQFSLSAVVFQARGAGPSDFRTGMEHLRDAAYAAELLEGRDFGLVSSAPVVEFPATVEVWHSG